MPRESADRKILFLVILCSGVLTAAGLAWNLSAHQVPWANERDGFFLIGTAGESLILQQHPLGFPVLLKLASPLLGTPFRAGQILSALFAWAFVVASYLFIRRLFDSRPIALLTAATVVALPAFVQNASLCTADMIYNLLALFALHMAMGFGKEGGGRQIKLGLLLGLIFFTKSLALPLLIAISLAFVGLAENRRRAIARVGIMVAVFLATVLVLGAAASLVLKSDLQRSTGWRIGSLRLFLQAILFFFLLVPPFPMSEGALLRDIFPHLPVILFRVGANLVERIVEIGPRYAIAPLAALALLARKSSSPEKTKGVRLALIVVVSYTLILFHITSSYDDITRYLLWLGPFVMGGFYFTIQQGLEKCPKGWVTLGRALAVMILLCVTGTMTMNTLLKTYRNARYRDWTTQGDRRHPSAEQLEEAVEEWRRRVGPDPLFASATSGFGLFDKGFFFYDWFLEGNLNPDLDVAIKDAPFYHESLRRFLCAYHIPYYFHDPGDAFLSLRWEGYAAPSHSDLLRFAPVYLKPAFRQAAVEIYQVDLQVCEIRTLYRPRILPEPGEEGAP